MSLFVSGYHWQYHSFIASIDIMSLLLASKLRCQHLRIPAHISIMALASLLALVSYEFKCLHQRIISSISVLVSSLVSVSWYHSIVISITANMAVSLPALAFITLHMSPLVSLPVSWHYVTVGISTVPLCGHHSTGTSVSASVGII